MRQNRDLGALGEIPTGLDVQAAGDRLLGHVRRTPVFEIPDLNDLVDGRVFAMAENLQITGSFKVRGAFNRLLQLSKRKRERGVLAWSAGNHGQALAYAGWKLGVKVTIVMPEDAPATKVAGTVRWGAEVVFYDRHTVGREELGRAIAARTGAIIVPPYDDPNIIAGQGTAALELIGHMRSHGAEPDRLVICVGGGGLIAGCALAARFLSCGCEILAAEPVGYDDTRRSLVEGKRVKNDFSHASIADALLTVTPGQLTFPLNRELVAGGYAVTDAQIAKAVRFAFNELRLVVEPGGAAALAALIANPDDFTGSTGFILSGGNVDAELFSSLIVAAEGSSAAQQAPVGSSSR